MTKCDCGHEIVAGPQSAVPGPESARLKRATLGLYVGLAIAALCPVFSLVYWPVARTGWWLGLAIFMGSAVLTVSAQVGLVASARGRSRWLVFLTALAAWVLSLPSVLTVAVLFTVRFTSFGEGLGSIAEGGADSAGAFVLVLMTAMPLALVIAPVPVVLLYIVARRQAKLLKPAVAPGRSLMVW